MNSIKNIIRKLYRFFLLLFHVNWIKTFYVNLRLLPLYEAIHLPILVYYGYKFDSLKGSMIIKCKPCFGLLKIGCDFDKTVFSNIKGRITLDGCVYVYGYVLISKGITMEVVGQLHLHRNVMIGSGCFIKSLVQIEIGNNTRLTYNCTLFDCNMHYIKNIETGEIKNNRAPIRIGNNCWINSGSVIMKGGIVPNYTITAKNTFIGKDYSEFGTNLFLVGSPAKPTKSKVQRILSVSVQSRLNTIFKNGHDSITLESGVFTEDDDEIENDIKQIL